MPKSLGELAEEFDCELIGDPGIVVERVDSLDSSRRGALSFLSSSKFVGRLSSTQAAAVILRAEDADACPTAALITDDPYATYARIASVLHPPSSFTAGIHPSAVVDESATVAPSAQVAANAVIEGDAIIGEHARVGAGAYVGPGCRVGDHCRLHANVTFVRAVKTGLRCVFHSGCVIGADGFGNAMTSDGWLKVPQIGGVSIGNDVEIGSCTTVDCGAIGDTVIEDGVRLDNQIQIGHNVRIGEHTAMAAGAAVAGSAVIGKRCLMAGMVGIAGHITIGDDVTVQGKAMVSRDILKPGAYAGTFPVSPVRDWNRIVAMVRRLFKLAERVSRLEKKKQ
jgi:UDP-3-O-[3-hydroxymyristoyl] glucosamine N-acyltransferase